MIHLPPLTANTPIEDVRQRILTELAEDRLGYLTPYETRRTRVYSTEEYADRNEHPNFKRGVTIGPNLPLQLMFVAGISAVVGLVIATRVSLPFPKWLAYPLSFAVIYTIFRLIPDFHRKITIDPGGIQIHDDRFEWANMMGIYAAVTVWVNTNRMRKFLVIFDRDGSIHAYELKNLAVSFALLCTVIEYFRTILHP